MFNYKYDYQILDMLVFFLLWYVFTILTSGTALPAGIFMPCIMIGCALGEMYYTIATYFFPDNQDLYPQSYALIGAAAMLSGSTRMTYSLAVIMLETS